ncbi:cytochrome c oxidase assembly protein [Oceanobacillus bengalensis]|uniref:Cytochrome c oxidase assembly factor CtaG n=1 Tax=Oceanobacillus bengalensis TaxID=1435466 RepID=A0A494Z809_9BACI|nr:cytochrome c oxidase assembly protein [Oceanobacillus bengalensis]RKQ18733.1 hypothetical protein D8M05_01085 [Oceanobacillus bengalensis]
MLEIILDEFHASTLWNGGIFIFTAFAIIIYFLLLPSSGRHSIWKSFVFLLGLIAIYASLGSPLNIIGRIKFSTHMIQIVLLLLVAPPLVIIGFKNEIIRKAIKKMAFARKLIQVLTKPIVAIILFYVLFYGYHIPVIFNYARLDLYLNYFVLLALFIAAILLWVPILKLNYLTAKQKGVYGLLNIILIIPYSIILFTQGEGIYSLYTDIDLFMSSLVVCLPNADLLTPDFFQSLLPFDPVKEQQLGGVILLLSQIVIFALGIVYGRKISK